MTPELSLAWGALLTAHGNGEQLQFNYGACNLSSDDWSDRELNARDMNTSTPDLWRRKPKTRTLTIRVYTDGCKTLVIDSDEPGMGMSQDWVLHETFKSEVPA
jgi:hypothetical protein